MGSQKAQEYHSVIFVEDIGDGEHWSGVRNTWDDWHLIPATRPEFVPPKGITKSVDIPGSVPYKVDITEMTVKHPLFENRSGTLSFIVENDYGEWKDRYLEIRSFIHGRNLKAILEDDPNFYYEGRFSMPEWKSTKYWSTLDIKYVVAPYKHDIFSSIDDWLWDPFDFEIGIINRGSNLTVNNELVTYIYSRQEQVSPVIVSSAPMIVSLNGELFNIQAGRSRHPLMVLEPGLNTFIFRGNGTISIEYRGGML